MGGLEVSSLLRPAQRRAAVQAVQEQLSAKERPVCLWHGVNRKLLRYRWQRNDEPLRLVALAAQHRRYGLPRLTVLLRREGITDNHKRIGGIYRAATLQVRKRMRRKLALGRGPLPDALTMPNQRWSLDLRARAPSDEPRTNRRFCTLWGAGNTCSGCNCRNFEDIRT